MPLILALLFAIPSYGLSIVLYIVWILVKANVKVDLRKLSDIEKAVYHVAENEKGSATAFNEISFDDVSNFLIFSDIHWDRIHLSDGVHLEFDLLIGRRKYSVDVVKEPSFLGDGAIFRAKVAQPWVDQLYTWTKDSLGAPLLAGKYAVSDLQYFVLGFDSPYHIDDGEPVRLPECIGNLTKLQVFRVKEKTIVSLPRSIGNLKSLKEINLQGNALMFLPKEICTLPELEILLLSSNKLKELPAEFGALPKLDILDLSRNELSRLPDSIVKLKKLGVLYLDGNKDLVVSPRQKKWIVELMKNGTRVSLDDDFYRHLKERFPEIPPHLKESLHWEWVEPDTAEAD